MNAPVFPPLITGHQVAADQLPMDIARSGAATGQFGAGDLIWSDARDAMRLALVLEPDVPRVRCAEMLYLAMVAFGDAAGAVIPAEIPVTYSWPNLLRLNGGRVGRVDLVLAPGAPDTPPDWMIVAVSVTLGSALYDPGQQPDVTTFYDEGCGMITAVDLIDSAARHLVASIHDWQHDGFRPIHDHWWARCDPRAPLSPGLTGRLIGLDEHGNALLGDTAIAGYDTLDALVRT